MKRVFVACLGLLAVMVSAAPSTAADLPPRYARPSAQPAVYSPIYNWTGFYLGINGGAGWGSSQWDGVDTFTVSGGLIGGTIGYNWQFGQLVTGIEGDIGWSGIRGSTNTNCAPGCDTRNHWLATARARLGYAFDRFLPYLTAGLAIGDIAATTPGWPAGSVTTAGWTVGAGLEFGIVSNVSIKAEYLFVDLGDFNCGFNCGLVGNGNVSFYSNLFRAGLNVRFPPYGP
jgi:outer membrane immunogenic protein